MEDIKKENAALNDEELESVNGGVASVQSSFNQNSFTQNSFVSNSADTASGMVSESAEQQSVTNSANPFSAGVQQVKTNVFQEEQKIQGGNNGFKVL